MPAIAVLGCLAAWSSFSDARPHCITCHSGDVRHAPCTDQPRRHLCRSCGCEFVWVDDIPFEFHNAVDALSRPRELYGR